MKPIVMLPLLAGAAIASEITDLVAQYPPCSLKCLIEGAQKHGCTAIDYQCQCTKTVEITKTVSPCFVEAGCRLKEIGTVVDTVSSICAIVARQASGENTTSPASSDAAPTPSEEGGKGVPGAASRNLGAAWGGAAALAAVAAAVL